MRSWTAGFVGALGGLAAGFLLAAEADPLRAGYESVRSQARAAIKPEKNRVRPPRIRLTEASVRVMTTPSRPCPSPDDALVILAGGQSNAGNVIPTRYTAGDAVSVWYDGQCYPASDPLPGATGDDGSIWSMLGDAVAKQTVRPVVLVLASFGGTQFRDWNDPRTGLYDALEGRLVTARQAGFRPDVILWHQGETDAGIERDFNALQREMVSLTDRLLKDAPGASLYLFQVSRCRNARRLNGVPEMIAVFGSVAAANPRVVLGMNTDVLGKEYRWDECHFNARGREAIVETSLPQIIALLQPQA